MKKFFKSALIFALAIAILTANQLFSSAAVSPEEYEAIASKSKIEDSEFAHRITDSESQIVYNDESVVPGSTAVVFKLPLPPQTPGQKLESYIFRYTTRIYSGSTFKLMKMEGDDWDESNLRYNDEAISEIIASPNSYKANVGEIIVQDVGAWNSFFNYADLSTYANECVNNGQSHMYLLMTSTSTAKVFGYVTDTDYINSDLTAYYYYTYGDADILEFVSSEPSDRSENTYMEFAQFKYNNAMSSAVAIVNGEETSCICKGSTVVVEYPLNEYSDYEISVAATDVYGQSLTKTVRFSTGGSSGTVSVKDGGYSYAVKATGTAESNRNSIDLDTGAFMLYKIPLPKLVGTQSLGSFVFDYTVLGKSEDSTLLKFPGDEWDISTMKSTGENVSEITSSYLSDGSSTQYNAVSSKTVTQVSNTIFKVSADVTAYADECIRNGQEYMWLGAVTTSTMNCYGFGYSDDYEPLWSYATMNPMYKAIDAKVSIEENSLTDLSFKLLTTDEDINDYLIIKNVNTDAKLDANFEYDSASGRIILCESVALEDGATYALIIKSGAEDDYDNVLSSDMTVTKFTNVSFDEIPDETESNPNLAIDIDANDGIIDIYYKNPFYANRTVKVVVVNTQYDDAVYSEEIVSNTRGTIAVDGISLSESGNYLVTIYPEFAEAKAEMLIRYYSTEDIENLWNIAAVCGLQEEISDNWSDLVNFFGLKEDNLEYVSDFDVFFAKLSDQRPQGIEEYNEDNKKAYITFADTMALFTALEQCDETEALKALLNKALGKIKAYDSQLGDLWSACVESDYYDSATEAFMDANYSIDTVEDLAMCMSEALDVYKASYYLELIANVEHGSEITKLISDEDVAKALGISKYMDDFNKLKSKTSVEKALTKKFDDAETFAKAFEKAVETALDKQNEKKTPSSSNNSSTGSKGGTTNFTAAGSNNASQYATGESVTINSPFVDLTGYEWAKTHIDTLYTLGAINGKTETEFSPADTIKREEFVKLIVSLMKYEAVSSDASFDDVESGSWYESYINIAVSKGIANGIGNNLFGTGNNASRQDIAVMIVNALKESGVEMLSGELKFADSQNIADYAKDAVAYLASKGVITGNEAGLFNPANNATRAEVAVMLSRVYNTFLKEVR